MADNWYVVLELDFDPPVEDEQKIEARIGEKAKFWSTHHSDFKYGPEYRRWSDSVAQIRKDMIGPANIRKQLAADACACIYGPVDKMLHTIARKGYVTSDEIANLAKKLGVDGDTVGRRVTSLGIRRTEEKRTDYPATYDKYYKSKPQGAANYDGLGGMLESFGVKNLYEFLFMGTPTQNADKLSCSALLQRTGERKKKYAGKNNSESGTGNKLCNQCQLAFKDETSKDVYDRYLEYSKRRAVLDYVRSVAEISGELTPEQGDDFIGQLTEVFRDRALAEKVFTAFCKVEKIVYNRKEGPHNEHLKMCRFCGHMSDTSDGRLVCQNCGKPLIIRCPQCGAENESSVKVCRCGFRFENLDRAAALCELAQSAMGSVDFAAAEAHLADAEHYWPGSEDVKALRARLSEDKRRVGPAAEAMRAALGKKHYVEARRQYDHIRNLFPDFTDEMAEETIEVALAAAKSAFQSAQAASREADVIDGCIRAYEACADYPGVRELVASYPPAAPTNLRVSSDGAARANVLSWTASRTAGTVFYTVRRKKDARPMNPEDGESVCRVSMCGCNDGGIIPGYGYFYAVFAERAGVYSAALASAAPVVNLFEIAGVTAAAADSALELEWGALPQGATAEILRVTPSGKEEPVKTCAATGCLVPNLTNDAAYTFHVRLSYAIGGREIKTKGITVTGTPTRPPKAVVSLRIRPGRDGVFEAEWEDAGGADVRLYGAADRPEWACGDVISMAALEQSMRRLALNRTSPSSGTFAYKGGLLYVSAVVVKSGSAVFGALARASRDEAVAIHGIRGINGRIYIAVDPPRGATGFVVLYRFDQYPADIGDVKAVRRYIPLKLYQQNSALVVDSLEPKNYYFSVFAEFTRDGEKDYSSGTDYLFVNASKETITYSITPAKKLFGESSILLRFEGEHTAFVLPAIDIVSAVGNTPMFRKEAKLFYTVPSQPVDGSLQVRIPWPKGLERDTYIKAFLRDEHQLSAYQLKLRLHSDYRIN